VAGRNQVRAVELGSPWGARVYESSLELLQKERPDGVLLTLPPHLHGDVERACAEHVAAVLVEKPLANRLEPAQQALEAFSRAGTLVSVGYQNRYRAGIKRARRHFLAAADKPVLVTGSWVGDVPPPAWWRDASLSGGQFVEQCTHVVDLARYLVGDVVDTQTLSTRSFATDPTITVDDAFVMNARFHSGALGQFSTGCFSASGFESGSDIRLRVASRSAVARFSQWGFSGTLETEQGVETFPAEPDIFELQARAFVQAWKTGNRSLVLSDYADALETLKLTLALKGIQVYT
jgi:predicted dehydrogenase